MQLSEEDDDEIPNSSIAQDETVRGGACKTKGKDIKV